MATIEQRPVVSRTAAAGITNGRWMGYARLLQMRMLELWREPEVIFWVFVFPLLLALGWASRFARSRPTSRRLRSSPGRRRTRSCSLLQRSPEHAGIRPDVLSAAAALDGFRLGKYSLVVSMDDAGVHYQYDPARPGERAGAHAGERCAGGRSRPQESHRDFQHFVERARRAIHRLPHPRLAGHEPDELGHVGHRLRAGGDAAAQTAEALCRDADAPLGFSAGAGQQPAGADDDRSRAAAGFRRAGVSPARRGQPGWRFC